MPWRRSAILLIAALAAGVSLAPAQNFTVFDRTFLREGGEPAAIVVAVDVPSPGTYTLRIDSAGAASAAILLNGVGVAAPSDFPSDSQSIKRQVTLQQSNTLSVEMRGETGGTIRLSIGGQDGDRPTVRAVLSPAPNAGGWNNSDVTVSFVCSDTGSGVATCPAPVVVTTEGVGQAVSGTAVDRAGNTAGVRVLINLDKTAPVITGATRPAPNAAGWNNSDLRVVFDCIDELSKIAECTPPVTIAGKEEGTREVPGTARDRAGNVAAAGVQVNLDATPPSIVATPDRAPDPDGWYTAPVVVSFTCADDGSGVASCAEPVRVAADGKEIVVPGTAIDRAGNSSTTKFLLSMRSAGTGVAPGLAATVTPPPNAAGWNSTPVSITFACTDSGSGIQACPPPQTLSADGVHQVSATASDPLGNTRSISLTVRIDTTPPAITAVADPAPDPDGWHRVPVTVSFTCADALSGVVSCPAPIAVATTGSGQVVSGIATDLAGHSSTASVTLDIDIPAPPTNRPPVASAGGPYAIVAGQPLTFAGGGSDPDDDPLTFAWTFGDGGTAAGATPAHTYLTAGDYTATLTVTDGRGGSASVTASVTVTDAPPPPTNRAPVANAGGPYSITAGQPLTFTGEGSDPDGDPLTFAWTFGDGAAGTGATPAHTYSAAGEYTATLTIDDGRGGSVSAIATVTVTEAPPPPPDNRAPTASAGGPYAITAGQPLGFAGSGSDPDGDPLTFSWTFGDGGSATGATPVYSYAAAGGYTATLTVSDGRGGSVSVTATVTVSAEPPPPNREPSFTSSPIESGAHLRPYLYQALALDPDGDPLTFSIAGGPDGMTIGASTGQVLWTPQGSQLGNVPVVLAVADGRGGTATQSFTVAVADASAPVVTLMLPSEALPGAAVTATAEAADNIGVVGMRFEINGADPTDHQGPPFQRSIQIPANALTGTEYHVRATATDAAGNLGHAARTIRITATPDLQPPSMTFNAAAQGTPGSLVRLSAAVADNVGVRAVVFRAGDAVLSTDTDAPFEASFLVPADAAVGSSLTLSARAFDYSDNFVDAVGTLLVVAVPDSAPPAVQLVVPPTVPEGGMLTLSATAADNVGVAGVTFFVNGVVVGSAAAAPYSVQFRLAADVAGGTAINVEARATDASGLTASSAAMVLVLAAPNRAPTANAGGPYSGELGQQIRFTAAASSDPDAGDRLSYLWDFGDQASGSGLSPSHAYLTEGTFTVTLTVDDGRGGVDTIQASALVTAATDRDPPAIALTGPATVLPGSQVTVTASATDNRGITGVAFEVDGGAPADVPGPPFQRVVDVPPVASPGDRILVRATARDAAGNHTSAETSLTIGSVPDTVNPTVAVALPPSAAGGSTLQMSASATDEVGVQSVTFSVNGVVISTLLGPPFEAAYPVPADAPAGASIGVVVTATDYNGNRGEASGTVAVVPAAEGDSTPPSIALSAPLQVFEGRHLDLTATAQDNVGLSSVRFFVNGVNVITLTRPPFAFSYPVTQASGTVLTLRAEAVDLSGLTADAAAQALVASAATAGQGVLSGEVYDDTRGLPLAGVTVQLSGADVTGAPYAAATTSDHRGRWVLRAAEGQGAVRFTRDGWTRVDRPTAVVVNQSIELIDARLTPLSAPIGVSAVLGGTVTAPGTGAQLVVPSGSLGAAANLSLTSISQQGLQGLLPPGWSPVAVADIAPHATAFANAATLSLPNALSINSGVTLVVARWDADEGAWRATGSVIVPAAGPLTAEVQQGGQYAWLLADAAPSAPVLPAPGDLLDGVARTALALDASTLLVPQPRVLFYSPDVRSDVRGAITSPVPISSGLPIEARIVESYLFLDGGSVRPEPFAEDLIFFQAGEPAQGLAARFVATPSQAFDPLNLQQGVITVELLAPALGPRTTPALGPDGGSASSPDGEVLQIPQGALSSPLAVTVDGLGAASAGITLPPGLGVVGAARVSFAGQFARAATLSAPRPPTLPETAPLLLVRAAEIGGETKFVLAGRGVIVGATIVSDTTLNGVEVFEGVRQAGRYFFVTSANPFGFATGRVLAPAGGPFTGALVTAQGFPVVSLSAAAGTYAAATPVGAVTLTALDLVNADTAIAAIDVAAAGAVVPVDLALTVSLPRVTAVTPADGAGNVALSDPVVIRFSKTIAAASISGANAGNIRLTLADGTAVSAAIGLSSSNQVVTLRPAAALEPNTVYTVVVGEGVTDLAGRQLAADVTTTFTSLDTAPPPMPAAGTIQAAIPDADGFTTITATQGTAATHDTVTIVNLTRRTTSPVLLAPNGGFTVRVAAALTDQLQIAITDANGNQTIVPLARFTRANADGSVSVFVGAEGGRVEGGGGTAADIAAGTFPSGAIVTIKPVPAASFPVTLNLENAAVFSYAGGFEIDFGGAEPTRYVDVSIPAAPGVTADDQFVVSQVVNINGQPSLNVADTARLIGGRVTTSSPPCPGVLAAGVYGVHKTSRPVGKTFGILAPSAGSLLAHVSAEGVGGFLLQTLGFTDASARPFCLPVLTGRVTITANSVNISFWPEQLVAGDEFVRIKNVATGAETRVNRDDLAYRFPAPGALSDNFAVTAVSGGSRRPIDFTMVADVTGALIAVVPVGALAAADTDVDVVNLSTIQTATYPRSFFRLTVPVSGGTSDLYEVNASNIRTGDRPLMFALNPSALGPGNLVLRALPSTIDPTQAEIDHHNKMHPNDPPLTGRARNRVTLVDLMDPTNAGDDIETTVPATAIVGGGMAWAFAGNLSHTYHVRVYYNDGMVDVVPIQVFRIVVTNDAGATVKTIVLPSPPMNGTLDLGSISDNLAPPALQTPLRTLQNFDPSGILTLTFDEPLDEASVRKNFRVLDAANRPVIGEVRLSNNHRSITFLPSSGLSLGQQYTVRLAGVTDLSNTPVPALRQYLALNTIKPRLARELVTGLDSLGQPRPLGGLKDLQILRRQVGTGTETKLVAVTDTRPAYKFVTINVTNPLAPVDDGRELGGSVKQRVSLLTGVSNLALAAPSGTPCTTGASFTGDLALTATDNTQFSFVTFYSVTAGQPPCLLGGKLLTANPETLTDFSRRGTVYAVGHAEGVAALQHTDGVTVRYMAYTAVADVGLFATDIGRNIPEPLPADRTREPMLPGDYIDVAAASNRLLALNRAEQQLEVIDPSLSVLATLGLGGRPTRMLYVQRLPFDANRNGAIGAGEYIDAAIIAAGSKIVIVDVTNIFGPRVVSTIPMPGALLDIDVDRAKLRLVASAMSEWYIVDYTRAPGDANGDGVDDRVGWREKSPSQVYTVEADPETSFIYVGTEKGLQVFNLGAPNLSGVAEFTSYPMLPRVLASQACGTVAGDRALCGGLDYSQPERKPIRGAVVELYAGGSLVATTQTDAIGHYSFDAPLNTPLKLVVKAVLSANGADTVRVVDNGNNNKLWTKELEIPAGISGYAVRDIYAETEWVAQTAPPQQVPPPSYTRRDGAPFSILDAIYRAQTRIREIDPGIVFPLLTVQWSTGNTGAGYTPETVTLSLAGQEDADTDEYDTQVVLHEWFHYFVHQFGRSDSVRGTHVTGQRLDARLAFNEAFATAFAAMVTGDPYYADTGGVHQMVGLEQHAENDIAAGGGFFDEDAMVGLIWDLADAKSQEPDSENVNGNGLVTDDVQLEFKELYQALKSQKTTTSFVTIFSFLDALVAPHRGDPATMSAINAVARAEGITLVDNTNAANADANELFTTVTIAGVDVGRLYTEIANGSSATVHGPGPFAGQDLQSRFSFGAIPLDPANDGNKLYGHVFFKFTVPAAGQYDVEVTPITSQGFSPRLSLRVKPGAAPVDVYNVDFTQSGSIHSDRMTLEPGITYVASVTTGRWLGPNNIVPAPGLFTIRVRPAP